jgi:hypothetical protein
VPHNVCAVDECTVDAECPASPQGIALCAPADTLGSPVRHCLFATCRTDSDCNEQPGGICATITDPCCSSPNALACVYPGDGCRSQQDCNDGTHCAIEDARARCLPGLVTCPA